MGWGSPGFINKGAQTSAAGNVTPVLPSGVLDSCSFMLLICETATEAVTAPAGWTQLTGSPVAATATRLTVFYRRFVTGDGNPTITFTGNHISARILAFECVLGTGDPVHAYATSTPTVASSGTITWPAVTTTIKNTFILNIGSHPTDTATAQSSNEANATLSARSGYFVERLDEGVTTGDGGGVFLINGPCHLPGSSGQTTSTLATGATLALLTVALSPVNTVTDLDDNAARILVPSDKGSTPSPGYGRFGRYVHVGGKRVLVGSSRISETDSLRNGYRYYGGVNWDTERRVRTEFPESWALTSAKGSGGLATGGAWSYLGWPFGWDKGAVVCINDDNSVATAIIGQGVGGNEAFGARLACTPDGTTLVVGGYGWASGGTSLDPHVFKQSGAYSGVVTGWTNCRSYYKLDETSGTAADDLKNNNEGTFVNSPTLGQATGPILGGTEAGGKCATFSAGSSQYVRCATSRIVSGAAGEVYLWVRTTAAVAQTIYCERSTSSGSDVLRLSMTSGGYLKTEYANDSGVTNTITTTNSRINDGKWHLVGLRNGSTMSKTCYVDGGGTYLDVAVNETFTNTNVESWIGGDPRDGNYWTGDISHVALFNGAAGYSTYEATNTAYAMLSRRLFPTRKRLTVTASYTYDSTHVAISSDGSVIATMGFTAGSTNTGKITVFSGTDWATETTLVPSDAVNGDYFCEPWNDSYYPADVKLLHMSSDGSTIVAGSRGADSFKGAVYVWNGTNWGTQTKLVSATAPAIAVTGSSLAITPDASVIAVGTPVPGGHGSYVSVFSGTNWATETKLPAPVDIHTAGSRYSMIGTRVAISDDGTKVAAAAADAGWGIKMSGYVFGPWDDSYGCVYVWRNSGSWSLTDTLSPTNQMSTGTGTGNIGTISMSGDGRVLVIAQDTAYDDTINRAYLSGKAWVFGLLPGGNATANAVIKGTQSGTTSAAAVPATNVAGSAWARNSVAAVGASDVTLVASTSQAASVCTTGKFAIDSLVGATFSFEVSLTGGGKMDIGVLDATNPDSTVGSDAFAGVTGFFGARLDLTNNRVGDVIDGTVVSYATHDPESPSGTFTIDAVFAL